MKLNVAETLLVSNPVRGLVQRLYEVPLLRKLGGRVDDAHVLEIGCGRGVGVRILLEQLGARHVCGIDLDPLQVERAKRQLGSKFDGRFYLVAASVDLLPFPGESFDAIFDFGVLHHVLAWQAGIGEIRRVLRPRGRFFFEEVTRAALNRWLYRTFLKHPVEHRFSEAEFVAELAVHEIELLQTPRRILADEIFIGAGRRRG